MQGGVISMLVADRRWLTICHGDEGTERTWFEPEQRPRKRVPKQSVHGKHPREGQAKRTGAKTTSPDGKAGHVMTLACHRVRQEERQVRPCKCPCRKYAPGQLAQRFGRLNCRAKQCQVSTSS